ncbi:DNA repair photolyase [Pyrobaculum oguniense TE7]|uniref:DNA repair photolyase n=1 Tax=Pyrobaculum oguniense (strain DSM 13380 / JCM 10595 / TE7) TaxID=698757 RepID=H6Q893_PYROT|nr:DNA repair photolyase [Pyrobaculum oguniense TE7]
MKVYEIRVQRALSPSGLPEYDYALNPYVGCLHGCHYCYAIDYTKGPPGKMWGSVVYVKANLLEVLRREVRRLKPGVVGLSTITDPYQPPEAFYKLSRGAIEVLAEAGFHVSVQTKSGMVVRDLDVLKRYREMVDVGITITTLRDKARILEPMAAHPLARARAVEKLAAEGVRVWIFMGPIIPGFNDSPQDIEEVVRVAHSTGAELIYDKYRPRPMADARLAANYRKVEVSEDWWARVKKAVEDICAKVGARCVDAEEEWAAARRHRR